MLLNSNSELNCRTDSNIVDVLTGILYNAAIPKPELKAHMQARPFKQVCWDKNIISRIVSEQQTKADQFIKQHINKIKFKEDEENNVLSVPDEVRNIHGFTSIPPFLRIFPSELALQSLK